MTATGPAAAPEPLGGDPACWLDRVCDACGRFVDDPFAEVCPVCGASRLEADAAPTQPPAGHGGA